MAPPKEQVAVTPRAEQRIGHSSFVIRHWSLVIRGLAVDSFGQPMTVARSRPLASRAEQMSARTRCQAETSLAGPRFLPLLRSERQLQLVGCVKPPAQTHHLQRAIPQVYPSDTRGIVSEGAAGAQRDGAFSPGGGDCGGWCKIFRRPVRRTLRLVVSRRRERVAK
ncbi:MAG: hypothetical protein U1A77_16135 [Pirellulales bacterium]